MFLKSDGEPSLDEAFRGEFEALLSEYVVYGSFPAVVKGEDVKIGLLKNLVSMYAEKDVFGWFGIREVEKFGSLMEYLALSSGSIPGASSACRNIGLDYRALISYLSVLANTYVIRSIYTCHTNRINEIKKAKKVYFYDLGFRNPLPRIFTPVANRSNSGMLENFVLSELILLGFEP